MTTQTAVLVIDLQKEAGFHLERIDEVVSNARSVIDAARQLNIPLLYTRHVNDAEGQNLAGSEPVDEAGRPTSYRAGTPAVEILEVLAPASGDTVIDKHRYSAFHGTDLDAALKKQNIRTLVVIGVLTDVCVMTTVFDAYQHNYEVVVVADACTATTLAAHYSALLILTNWIYGLSLFSSAELLKQWSRQASVHLATQVPDHFAFQPEAFVPTIKRLETALNSQPSSWS